MLNFSLGIWWLAILWTYTEVVPRPFDDWKNGLLYVGAGVLVLAIAMRRKVAGGAQLLSWGPRLRGDERSGATGPATFLLIAISYFLLCAVSIAVAPTGRYEGLLELARLIVWAGLAWALAQCSVRTWVWLMRVTVVSAAIIALLTWFWQRGADIWPYVTPWLAPIGHITYYGDFMALSLVMAVGLVVHILTSSSARWQAALWIPCLPLIGIGLALSATRASLAGLVAAGLLAVPLVGYASRSFRKTALITLIFAVCLAFVFAVPMKSMRGASAGERMRQFTDISQATLEALSSGRWHTYVTSARAAMERPWLGWGLGTFRFVYPEFAHRDKTDLLVSTTKWYMHPHNEVLHQAVELGWPGAALFLLGAAYLLYRGIRALRRDPEGGDDDILLITALCGLTVAFVSWQFSTNFLFPVSRLMTALFAGIIMSFVPHDLPLRGRMAEGQERGKCTWAMITIVSLSTLLLIAYQISLICVQKNQTATTIESARNDAAWAVRLAPGTFDPLFIRASVALRTGPPAQAASAIETFHAHYPYVPIALHMMGILRAQQGNWPEARQFLQHAMANDPDNAAAKQLLDQLPPEH